MRLTYLFYLLISMFCLSCSSEAPAAAETRPTEEISAEVPNAKAVFVADPQPVAEREVKTLEIGAAAPDFKLPGTDGKFHQLSDFSEAEVLLIVFTCNHCPTAQAYEGRIKQIASDYQNKGVQVVAISPNSPLGLLYEELGYSDLNDDYDEMILRAEDQQFNFPYLYDGDDEKVSLQYGPVATPHAYVFDKNRRLQYVGRLDKVEKPGTANAEDVRAAIEALLAGKLPETAVTKTFGCSTKWGWKTKYKEKVEKEWAEKTIDLNMVDEKEIKELIKNKNGNKLRLINVWATWCGPCVMEYPEFLVLHRMYGARDFEFISLSADKSSQQEKVLALLQKKNSAVQNFQFSGDDKYTLIEAVDPAWNGALPYTVLVEPGGQVVWSHQGEVDFWELKKTIVDHPMIGRYF